MLIQIPGFLIEIHDGPVRLVHLFRAKRWASATVPQDAVALAYRKLIDIADEADARVDADLWGA